MQRKQAILLAATEHFGRFGFRGASLRDIARDAGVSLTLLNHHFGSKASLLAATVDSQGARLDQRAAALAAVQRGAPGNWGVRELVQAWVGTDFATAATRDGRLFLQLVARIGADTCNEFDPAIRAGLERAAPVFIEALQRCCPQASRRAAESACLWLAAVVDQSLLRTQPLSDDTECEDAPEAVAHHDKERLIRFLAAGVEAALVAPIRAPAAIQAVTTTPETQESALAA
jgi:AcrR family transcriptional regulator